VQHSVMNDVNLKEYAALMISEPYVLEISPRNSQPLSTPKWLMKIGFNFATQNTAYT
jgi:hypothetical protein